MCSCKHNHQQPIYLSKRRTVRCVQNVKTVFVCAGLDNIHQLTHQRKSELLVDMEDFTGKKVFARYSSFSVESECDGYVLHVSGFKNGGAGEY